ncbi:MAG: hypothetical protein ACYCR9_01990 [Cuniculiplasma sp.]
MKYYLSGLSGKIPFLFTTEVCGIMILFRLYTNATRAMSNTYPERYEAAKPAELTCEIRSPNTLMAFEIVNMK